MSSPKMLATLFELLTVGEIMPSHIDEKIRTSSGHEMFVTEKTFSIFFLFLISISGIGKKSNRKTYSVYITEKSG